MMFTRGQRKVGLGAILVLFSMMVAIVPSFALPYGNTVTEKKHNDKKRRSVPEGDVLSMLGLSLGVVSCALVARRRIA